MDQKTLYEIKKEIYYPRKFFKKELLDILNIDHKRSHYYSFLFKKILETNSLYYNKVIIKGSLLKCMYPTFTGTERIVTKNAIYIFIKDSVIGEDNIQIKNNALSLNVPINDIHSITEIKINF